MARTALSPRAFLILLVVACLFGANHVAARLALDDGVDVLTAVTARSLGTAAVGALIVVGAVMALGLRRNRPAAPSPAPTGRPPRTRTGPGAPSR